MVEDMAHRIYAGSENEARTLAREFAGDGCSVRWDRPLEGSFILLEVRDEDRFLKARFGTEPF